MRFRLISLVVCGVFVLTACDSKTEPRNSPAEKVNPVLGNYTPCHTDINEVWEKGLEAKCDDAKKGTGK